MKKTLLSALLVYFLAGAALKATSSDSLCIQNQISLLGQYNPHGNARLVLGGQYVPQLDYLRDFSGDRRISAEVSGRLNLNMGIRDFSKGDVDDPVGSIRLYRAWVRLSSQRNEFRAGLQQLNFGSATLLRPLQWFDGIDPTDPLRMTNGVWGVLDRMYFKNNSTLWLWGLYGNTDARMWELYRPQKDRPELGLRFQQPVASGELALSGNVREVSMDNLYGGPRRIVETKIGLDGKWDIGPGIWFEESLTLTSRNNPLGLRWNLLTVGADFAPESIDGLSITAEHMWSHTRSVLGTRSANFSALMVSQSINLFSRLSGILLYSWETGYFFRYLTYSVDFDKSSVHLIGFWNPDLASLQSPLGSSSGSFAGYGLQLMYVVQL